MPLRCPIAMEDRTPASLSCSHFSDVEPSSRDFLRLRGMRSCGARLMSGNSGKATALPSESASS